MRSRRGAGPQRPVRRVRRERNVLWVLPFDDGCRAPAAARTTQRFPSWRAWRSNRQGSVTTASRAAANSLKSRGEACEVVEHRGAQRLLLPLFEREFPAQVAIA